MEESLREASGGLGEEGPVTPAMTCNPCLLPFTPESNGLQGEAILSSRHLATSADIRGCWD